MIAHDELARAVDRFRDAEAEFDAAARGLRQVMERREKAVRVIAPVVDRSLDLESMAAQVVGVVAREYGVKPSHVFCRRRTAHVALPRQVAMVLVLRLSGASLQAVGKAFQRDHGTVIHAREAIAARCETEKSFGEKFCAVEALCRMAVRE